MAEKTFNSRIIHKHDTETNWLKAVNFIPKQGEVIVYDVDDIYNYERIKVGDGETLVSALPFVDDAVKDSIGAVETSVSNLSTLVGDVAVSEQISEAVSTKADVNHTHEIAELTDLSNANVGHATTADAASIQYAITATSDDGVAYVATVPGIETLAAGVSFIMVPGRVSASTAPTINVNGLGAKYIRRRLSNLATALQAGYTTTWLAVNKPFTLVYDGTAWVVEGLTKPVGADLYGAAAKATADAAGNVITETYATIASLQALLPKVTSITLGTTWSGTASPYYQDIALSCCTETSMVDIQPTPEQLASWQDDGLAFTTLSGTETVRVYVAGGLPAESITVQVKVQEVVVV